MRAEVIIDVAALRHNLMRVRQLAPGSQIMAMVKGNAYGHGMSTVASYLRDVDYFGVACIEAAIALRTSGVLQPIVLIGGFEDLDELQSLLDFNIQLVIYQWQQIDLLRKAKLNEPITVWVKVDTGMRRLGFSEEYISQVVAALREIPKVEVVNWITHFACADKPNDDIVYQQKEKFFALTDTKKGRRSAANSAAIIQYTDTHLDVVRPGLMLYGVSPRMGGSAETDGLKPVMTFQARIMELHHVREGEFVGYNAEWRAKRPSRIAVVAAGYGDGYPQTTKSGVPVLIHGKEAPVVGRVSMDSLTIDVTDLDTVAVNDKVILWGKGLSVEKVAKIMGVSPYGLLTGVTARPKHKIKEE